MAGAEGGVGRWLVAVLLATWMVEVVADSPRIAIVIDDLGYAQHNDRAVLDLDRRISVAIIPDGPLAPTLSRMAAEQQREVLIHLPLSGNRHDNCDFGALCPGEDWSPKQMARHLRWAGSRVEGAIGINNHQGSRFTADFQAVKNLVRGIILLDGPHQVRLSVLDSRTTAQSLLETKARRAGLGTARRHVFLDNERRPEALERAWRHLIELARRNGTAVAIGHPHRETIEFLARAVPELDSEDVELVPISRVFD